MTSYKGMGHMDETIKKMGTKQKPKILGICCGNWKIWNNFYRIISRC